MIETERAGIISGPWFEQLFDRWAEDVYGQAVTVSATREEQADDHALPASPLVEVPHGAKQTWGLNPVRRVAQGTCIAALNGDRP